MHAPTHGRGHRCQRHPPPQRLDGGATAGARRPGRGAHDRWRSRRTSTTPTADTDAVNGCIREVEHAYSTDGGLAVLYGNLAEDGCIVKTAGVDESIWHFEGPARIFHSQEEACEAILGDRIKPGDVVVIRYEGPKGGPGMQEMLYPTSYLKAQAPRQGVRADHRRPLQRRHVGPEHRPRLAGGGRGRHHRRWSRRATASASTSPTAASTCSSTRRRSRRGAGRCWRAAPRPGSRSAATARCRPRSQAYALLTTSAARGAVRDVEQVSGRK